MGVEDAVSTERYEWRRPDASFGWLSEPAGRRGALREVHQAVARGWIGPGPRRRALARALKALVKAGGLSARERERIARIFEALGL